MSKEKTTRVKSIDGFGVIAWEEGQDPLNGALAALGADEDGVAAAQVLHGDLRTARAIAVSLFGAEWRDFVMDIYDRLVGNREDETEGDVPNPNAPPLPPVIGEVPRVGR